MLGARRKIGLTLQFKKKRLKFYVAGVSWHQRKEILSYEKCSLMHPTLKKRVWGNCVQKVGEWRALMNDVKVYR